VALQLTSRRNEPAADVRFWPLAARCRRVAYRPEVAVTLTFKLSGAWLRALPLECDVELFIGDLVPIFSTLPP
jgi:hypothetical protein